MPIDCFCVSALQRELTDVLTGSRVDKVQMPARDEIHISGRSPRAGAFRLLLSASSTRGRAHLTTVKTTQPAKPPMFCMLLRKHLIGGRFAELTQPPQERVLRFGWDSADELGEVSRKTLILEMTGRHANLILCDADMRVIDCLHRADNESSTRPLLPGLFYQDPPRPPGGFGGARDDPMSDSAAFTPILFRNAKGKLECSALPVEGVEGLPFEGTFSELFDRVYTAAAQAEAQTNRAAGLRKKAVNARDKLRRKRAILETEQQQAQNRDPFREEADLLMANLHCIERGAAFCVLEDFYHDNQPRRIALDVTRSPHQNAARLYKKFQKCKTAEKELTKQLEKTDTEILYWDSVIEQIDRADSVVALDEIREEIAGLRLDRHEAGGRKPGGKQREKEKKIAEPQAYTSSEGVRFWAGRNNRQNDLLTFKRASREDFWLHAQKIPGSHVVVSAQNGVPGEVTLHEAAAVAAWHSGGRNLPRVPVDCCRVKFVKKPPGSRPGFVIYSHFETLLVAPNKPPA